MIREWILVLYGTVFPPQKNDTIPIMQTMVKKKVGEMKFNKKSKNQTLDESSGKRRIGKVKKNNQRILTTVTSIDTSDEDLEIMTKKKTNASPHHVITTSRPRVTVKQPLLKSHSENGNNMYTKKTNNKGTTYGNKVSGKLPKQVNNNLFTTTESTIPKQFENYAKIEQFYPELRPIKEFNDPMFFTVTNNGRKVDQENFKSSSSMPTNYSPSTRQQDDDDNVSSRPKQQLKKMSKGQKFTEQIFFVLFYVIQFFNVQIFNFIILFLLFQDK